MVSEFFYSSFGAKLLGTRCGLREILPCCQLWKVSFCHLRSFERSIKNFEFNYEEFMTSIVFWPHFYDSNDVTGLKIIFKAGGFWPEHLPGSWHVTSIFQRTIQNSWQTFMTNSKPWMFPLMSCSKGNILKCNGNSSSKRIIQVFQDRKYKNRPEIKILLSKHDNCEYDGNQQYYTENANDVFSQINKK